VGSCAVLPGYRMFCCVVSTSRVLLYGISRRGKDRAHLNLGAALLDRGPFFNLHILKIVRYLLITGSVVVVLLSYRYFMLILISVSDPDPHGSAFDLSPSSMNQGALDPLTHIIQGGGVSI
jgi:hypothetical protein